MRFPDVTSVSEGGFQLGDMRRKGSRLGEKSWSAVLEAGLHSTHVMTASTGKVEKGSQQMLSE